MCCAVEAEHEEYLRVLFSASVTTASAEVTSHNVLYCSIELRLLMFD
jgi:hypothetical protein